MMEKTSKIAVVAGVLGIFTTIVGVGSIFLGRIGMAIRHLVVWPFSLLAMLLAVVTIILIWRSKGALKGTKWALLGFAPVIWLVLFGIILRLPIAFIEDFFHNPPPQEIAHPKVLIGSDFLSKSLFLEDRELGVVTDIVRGEFDVRSGLEIVIAGSRRSRIDESQGVLVMADNGDRIKVIRFSETALNVRLVDVEGDGQFEFMDRGGGWQPVSLFDHQGKMLWTYDPRRPAPNSMAAGDLDGDGILEFVVGLNAGGGVHLLNRHGEKLWEQPDRNVWHVEVADTNQDGQPEIVHSNGAGQLRVRDAQGKILSQAKPSSCFSGFTICRWPTFQDKEYALFWSEEQKLLLLDFDGKTVAQLEAPNSVQVWEIRGTPVRLKRDEPEYFAVILQLRGQWHRSILYVYDSAGALVFQEIIGEECRPIAALPSDTPGEEVLLIGGEGRVWQYKAG